MAAGACANRDKGQADLAAARMRALLAPPCPLPIALQPSRWTLPKPGDEGSHCISHLSHNHANAPTRLPSSHAAGHIVLPFRGEHVRKVQRDRSCYLFACWDEVPPTVLMHLREFSSGRCAMRLVTSNTRCSSCCCCCCCPGLMHLNAERAGHDVVCAAVSAASVTWRLRKTSTSGMGK